MSLTGCERIFGAGEGVLMRSIFLMRDGLMEVGEFIDEPILWIFLRLGARVISLGPNLVLIWWIGKSTFLMYLTFS